MSSYYYFYQFQISVKTPLNIGKNPSKTPSKKLLDPSLFHLNLLGGVSKPPQNPSSPPFLKSQPVVLTLIVVVLVLAELTHSWVDMIRARIV